MPTRQLALLRGINVGKHKQLPMAELRALMEELGYADVATHLRSGNVVYMSPHTATTAAKKIAAGIAERFGFDVDVVVRTAAEVAAVLAHDPLGDVASDGAKYLVVFLAAKPSAAARSAIEELDLGDERLRLHGREAYLWCPGGINESRAWKAFSRGKPPIVATARNWNTVRKLGAMLS